MGRLFWLILTLVGFVLAFIAKSPGVLGVGLFLGFAGFLGLVLAMAAARVSASARPDTLMASVDDLGALRKRVDPTIFVAPKARQSDETSDRTT